jgi:O-6-methylguanine DNA methyltransferase
VNLTDGLTALRVPAPGHILPGVLAGTGLADGYVTHDGPLGPVFVAFNERGISCVDLAGDPDEFAARFETQFGRPVVPVRKAPRSIAGRLRKALDEGRPGDLAVDLGSVTPFRAAVLAKAAEIPRGEVRPYGWIAAEIGKPGAVRAVGTALAANPVPLVVPCHRVVRSDGRFGDYSLGDPSNKRTLLEIEGLDTDGMETLARRGVRYIGSATTHIYCHPTCRDARRIEDANRVEFRNAAAAERDGYRACRRCRPVAAAA